MKAANILKLVVVMGTILYGCKTKAPVTKVETTSDKTVTIETEEITRDAIGSFIVVRELCDSITGLPKNFNIGIASGKNTGSIVVNDNKLFVDINIDSIKSVAVREFVSKNYNKDTFEKEVITNVVIPKWSWWSLGFNIFVLILFGFWLGKKINFGWLTSLFSLTKWFK